MASPVQERHRFFDHPIPLPVVQHSEVVHAARGTRPRNVRLSCGTSGAEVVLKSIARVSDLRLLDAHMPSNGEMLASSEGILTQLGTSNSCWKVICL